MIKRAVLVLAFGVCNAYAAVAQSLQVQSGEHATFSRMAIRLPDGADWSFSTTPGQVELEIPGFTFDVSDIFELMPRRRISSATVEGGNLNLQLNCDCPSEAFLFQNRFVIIDVSDGPPLPDVPEDDTVALAEPVDFARRDDLGTRPPILPPRSREPRRPGALQLPLSPDLEDNGSMPLLTERFVTEAETQEQASTPVQPSFPALEQDIVSGVADALTQGFLDPAPRRAPSSKSSSPAAEDLPTQRSGDMVARPSTDGVASEMGIADRLAENDAIKITGPDDRRISAPEAPEDTRNFDGEACIPRSRFVALAPDQTSTFVADLAKLRSRLFDERDRMDNEIAKKLVSHLLAFGFGAEARLYLEDFGIKDEQRVLESLSYIVDEGFDPMQRGAQAQLSCDGPSALWAALALKELPINSKINRDAVVRYYEAMSLPLRSHLGPTLSERLASAGHMQAAAHINRSLLRVLETMPVTQLFAEASLFRQKGQLEEADKLLTDLLPELTDTGAMAMIELVEVRLERNLDLTIEEAELIAARAYTDRTANYANELNDASTMAFAMAGRLDLATQALTTRATSNKTTEWLGVRLASNTTVEEFLHFVFDNPEGATAVIRHPDVVSRLHDLGFSEKAEMLGFVPPLEPLAQSDAVTLPAPVEFSSIDIGVPASASDRLRLSEAILESTGELQEELDQVLRHNDFEDLLTN